MTECLQPSLEPKGRFVFSSFHFWLHSQQAGAMTWENPALALPGRLSLPSQCLQSNTSASSFFISEEK